MAYYDFQISTPEGLISNPVYDVRIGEIALKAQYLDVDFVEYITDIILKEDLSEDPDKDRPNYFVKYNVWLFEGEEQPMILDIELSLLGMIAYCAFREKISINDFIVKATITELNRIMGRSDV